MRKIEIAASDERLITPSGLSLVGQVLGKSDFENVNEFHTDEEVYTLSLGLKSGIPSESCLSVICFAADIVSTRNSGVPHWQC